MAVTAGRPELPVDRSVAASGDLADFLRGRRAAAGVTYRQLSWRTGKSAATLERAAAGGRTVPAWDTVEMFVEMTVSKEEKFIGALAVAMMDAQKLWIRARRAVRAPYYVHTAPAPLLVASAADFSRALRDQHIWGGVPTPGEMERAAGTGELPRTTARRIINGTSLPVDPRQARAFLRACHADPTTLADWMDAGHRVTKVDSWLKAAEKERLLLLADKSIPLSPSGLTAVDGLHDFGAARLDALDSAA
ncbi:helix-turn-helix domain-containing protein [Streptomyces sp. NPDC059718]